MSTTVTYKGATLTTVSNDTAVLETAGKYLEDDLTLVDVSGGGTYQEKSVSFTPSESAQIQTVTADTGYDALDEVSVSVGAVSSTYVGSGITRRTSSNLSASGATVTAPAGYYESSASKSVASGTEGTPTATKGTVSNHSVNVTPSVTNSAGYISGGTKTGTAVTVSASELVSGTKSITANGTGIDVTEYQKVNVAVPSGSPTLQNKTVYPSSSDQSITADNDYDGLGTVSLKAVTLENLTAGNIKSGVTVKVGDVDDDDRIASVTGTLSGGSSYTLLGSGEFTVNTSSTSASSVGNVYPDSGKTMWDASKVIYVRIRDKAGKRNGYLYGSDSWILNYAAKNGTTGSTSVGVVAKFTLRVDTNGNYNAYSGGYGVYPYSLNIDAASDSSITIYKRYNSSYTGTINGTFSVEVYALDYVPNLTPFA